MAAPRILIASGLEPEGRAGLLADVQAVHACGALPVACAMAVTAQPAGGEVFVEPVSADALRAQLDAAIADGPIAAVKVGMLASEELAQVLLERLSTLPPLPIVVDPVLATSTGAPLFRTGSRRAAYGALARLRPILTPNLPELAILAGQEIAQNNASEVRQADVLLSWGAQAVLVKGGHRAENADDLLLTAEGSEVRFEGTRIASKARGKGCRLASAMAAFLGRGDALPRAIERARSYVRVHLESNAEVS